MFILRFLELPPVSKSLETLIDHMGVLYKFHDRPISYLYNTLHYYELRVRDRAMLKKKLISNIVGKKTYTNDNLFALTILLIYFLLAFKFASRLVSFTLNISISISNRCS
jgi:hypothetical protein